MTATGLTCRIEGTPAAPAVLFCHGFLGRGEDWRPVVERIGEGRRCLLVDLPGHGDSGPERVVGPWTIGATAAALIDLLDRETVEQCDLVGYSMGGRLALYTALRYPRRVRRLLLESASPGLESDAARADRRERDDRLAAALETTPLGDWLAAWYDQPLFAATLSAAQRAAMIAARMDNEPPWLARSLREMGTGSQPSLWAELADLAVPTLVVVGEHDRKYRDIAAMMVTRSAMIHVSEIPGAGHNVHAERPDAFRELLHEYLLKDQTSTD